MVELSVKDVRGELLRAAAGGERGEGEASTLLLGTLFHEVFADLVSLDERRSGFRVLYEAGEGVEAARRSLTDHAYRALVAPRLARHQAQLNESTQAVLTFWSAVQELTGWLTGVALRLREARGVESWQSVARWFSSEEELTCELRADGWTDSVRLTGTADSIVRAPGGEHFCAIELKLGRGRPAVDLGQAALYRLIAARGSRADVALALLRFSGEMDEVVIGAGQVRDAEAKLLALIGKMAGVAGAPRPAAGPARYADLAQRIIKAFREYGRPVELPAPPIVGPRFLRFEMKLGKGVAVSQLERLTPEVHIRAGLPGEPMVRRIGSQLFLDVERTDPETVPFQVVRHALRGLDPRAGSPRLPIGVDPRGELLCADLSSPTTAHVLVAGGTGSGKSEWLRMAIGGLMVANTPDTLRLALVDPKSSAFSDLRRSPWLLARDAFWTPGEKDEHGEPLEVVDFLDELVAEMERRYLVLAEARVDDLAAYVASGRRMPRLVCFIDEYYALVAGDRRLRKEIEARIGVLAAKGRAAGVHLVVAVQQASREVIKGTLDANLSSRVALKTTKAIESRLLLEVDGAERLSGAGDLLYRAVGDPIRLQAPYLAAEERARLFAGSG
jgi:S-DNA-T family DNA segregation ATPase FtsK/SpoIIIE